MIPCSSLDSGTNHGIYGAPRVFLDLRSLARPVASIARATDAREPLVGLARLSQAPLVRRQALRLDPEPPEAAVRGDAAEQGLGHGHHLHSDLAGLALLGRHPRSVLAQDRRMVDEADHSPWR